MIKLAILDLDGTILDSMGYWEKAPVDYLKNLGKTITPKQNEYFLSLSFPEGVAYLKEEFDIKQKDDELTDGINSVMELNYLNNVKIKGEFLKLLKCFKNHNIKMCIASATDHYLIEKAIKKQGIDKYIEYILSSTNVGTSKKKPDIYLMCTKHFNVKPTEAMIFEDLPYGLIATEGLGFTRVGLYDKTSSNLQEHLKNHSEFYFEEINDGAIETIKNFIERNNN